jgi:hypothetical protein
LPRAVQIYGRAYGSRYQSECLTRVQSLCEESACAEPVVGQCRGAAQVPNRHGWILTQGVRAR